jgi:RNA polymerase sigma factor
LLSKQEEIRLGNIMKDYKEGRNDNKKEAIKAHHKLVNNYIPMAYDIANKALRQSNAKHYTYEDIAQDTLLTLTEKMWDYDPSKNTKAGTYIYFWLKKAASTGINNSYSIKLGNGPKEKMYRVNKAIEQWEEEDSDLSKDEYIYKKTKATPNQIFQINNAITPTLSLDQKVNTDSFLLSEIIEDKAANIEFDNLNYKALIDSLYFLDDKEKIILYADLDINYNFPDFIKDMDSIDFNRQARKVYHKIKKNFSKKSFRGDLDV